MIIKNGWWWTEHFDCLTSDYVFDLNSKTLYLKRNLFVIQHISYTTCMCCCVVMHGNFVNVFQHILH